MAPGLTLCYISARRRNMCEWFFDSLAKQIPVIEDWVESSHWIWIVVVDHSALESGRREELGQKFKQAFGRHSQVFLRHVAPKPNVWSGPHRLTNQDWFSSANSRNTAICFCQTSHIAFVDDLSVLMPGWFNAVCEAIEGNYIGCGAYKKVKELQVENGVPVHYIETESGTDDRLRRVTKDVSECDGGWLYGCSFVAPLEDLLQAGGFPEYCDGLGSEDYCLGIALRNAGKHLKFDRRMMTLESEELHFVESPMKRTDYGVSPSDKSHAALAIAQGSKYFPNYYEGGIKALREHVLAGNPFPITQIPDSDWFTGQRLSEL